MIIISIIKCFVITILFSCLSLSSSNNVIDTSITSLKSLTNGANSYTNTNNMAKLASDSVDKGSCTSKSDCTSSNSYCDTTVHRCKCRSDYINITPLSNSSRTNQLTMNCLPVAKLDDKCSIHEQCLVTNSICMFVGLSVGSSHNGSHYCKCREGYHQEDKEEVIITKDNQKIVNHPICGQFNSMGNSWIGTFAIICIILLIILIGSFIGIIRFQRWKQRPMASTVTSLAAATGHTPHLMSSSPPPMGSVEAEFQNDFIQVFPMHHLEPLPDKNTSHEYVIK